MADGLSTLRRACYFLGRAIGDIQAIRRGPKAIVKRLGRKVVYKKVGKWTRW